LAAIKEVLARNDLYGFGAEAKATSFVQAITVQTQVNVPEAHVPDMRSWLDPHHSSNHRLYIMRRHNICIARMSSESVKSGLS